MSMELETKELAGYLELALLRPDAVTSDLQTFCRQAKLLGVASVVVCGARVEQARTFLEETPVKVSVVVGYPWGTMEGDVKRYEVEVALDHGAQELEVLPHPGWIKEGLDKQLMRELRDLVEAADERPVKVVLNLDLLSREEASRVAVMAVEAGAMAISPIRTGAGGEELVTDARFFKAVVGEGFGLKVNLPALDPGLWHRLVEAGATRFGVECRLLPQTPS